MCGCLGQVSGLSSCFALIPSLVNVSYSLGWEHDRSNLEKVAVGETVQTVDFERVENRAACGSSLDGRARGVFFQVNKWELWGRFHLLFGSGRSCPDPLLEPVS